MVSHKQTHANSSMWKVDCKKDNMKEMCCDLPRSRKRYGRFTQRPTCSGFYKSGAFSWNAGHTTCASGELRGKEENGEPLVSSRWNPTPEQVMALQKMYERGVRTPSADEIQLITTKLSQFGKIEGKNVFYWFQNHKARERQKRRRQTHSSSSSFDHPLKHAKDLEANSKANEEHHLQLHKKKCSDTLPDLSFMPSDTNPVSESFILKALCLGEKKETSSMSLNISLMTKNEDLFQVLPKRRNCQMLQLFPSPDDDPIRPEGNGGDDQEFPAIMNLKFTPKQFYVFL